MGGMTKCCKTLGHCSCSCFLWRSKDSPRVQAKNGVEVEVASKLKLYQLIMIDDDSGKVAEGAGGS